MLLFSHFSWVQLCVTPWTVARQAPLSMEFSRQEYWSGLPCPSPGALSNQGIEPEPPGKPLHVLAAAAAKSLQSCSTLCDSIHGSPPGSPVPGILQARTLEWVGISFSNAWKWKVKVKVKSCPTLSDPMDCSPPGSSIHGIFQARVLEWGAIGIQYYYIVQYINLLCIWVFLLYPFL